MWPTPYNYGDHKWKVTVLSATVLQFRGPGNPTFITDTKNWGWKKALNASAFSSSLFVRWSSSVSTTFSLDIHLLFTCFKFFCCLSTQWSASTQVELWLFLFLPINANCCSVISLRSLNLLQEIIHSLFLLKFQEEFPIQASWSAYLGVNSKWYHCLF